MESIECNSNLRKLRMHFCCYSGSYTGVLIDHRQSMNQDAIDLVDNSSAVTRTGNVFRSKGAEMLARSGSYILALPKPGIPLALLDKGTIAERPILLNPCSPFRSRETMLRYIVHHRPRTLNLASLGDERSMDMVGSKGTAIGLASHLI